MSTRNLVSYVLLLFAVSGVACDDGKSTDPDDTDTDNGPKLAGRDFISYEVLENGQPRDLVDGTALTVHFDAIGGSLRASAGCNTFSASYDIVENSLRVRDGASTEIGCEPPLVEQETWYFGFVGSSPILKLVGDELELDTGESQVRYRDEEVVHPDQDLVGPVWTVDTIIDGASASNADWPAPATIELQSDSSVTLFDGCNTGLGTYELMDATVRFVDLEMTEADCSGQLAGELAEAVQRVVGTQAWVEWEIDASRLQLQNGAFGLGLVTPQ